MSLPSGASVTVGDSFSGGGGYISGTAVSDMFGDAVLKAAQDCAGASTEVVVVNGTS